MAKLDNSKRRLHQAVYARVHLRAKNGPFKPLKPLLKWGLIAAAKPTKEELAEIRRHVVQTKGEQAASDLTSLASIESLLSARGNPDVAHIAQKLADVEADALLRFGELLMEARQRQIRAGIESAKEMQVAYEASRMAPVTDDARARKGFQRLKLSHLPTAHVLKREIALPPASRPKRKVRLALVEGERRQTELILEQPVQQQPEAPLRQEACLHDLAVFALRANHPAARVEAALELARRHALDVQRLTVAQYQQALHAQVNHGHSVMSAFKSQLAVEPIGFLHLERMTFAPDGIERGELVYSVPLSPGEEVNITHKEWTTTSEEFQTITKDSLEQFSEQGVAEKSELSEASSSEHKHANGMNVGVTASGGYGPVSVTSTLGVSVQDSASNTQEFSRKQAMAVTRRASARSKKEHKVSFKVASAAGTEDSAVRRIRNPFADKATRVDYYQLMRRWEVNAYRYGVRLTYDVTIPEPGSDVLAEIIKIRELNAALVEGFGGASKLPWAHFDLSPGGITRANYVALSAKYNAAVSPPPPERKAYDKVATHDWKTLEEAEQCQFWTLDVDVDQDYVIDRVKVDRSESHYVDEDWLFNVQSVEDFIGASGRRSLVYSTKFLGAAYVELRVGARLKDEVFEAWQLKTWSAMRDAAQARYYEQRALLESKLAKLVERLGAQDALSLRKLEREEVMKGVVRWLFGPDFDFVPKGVPADLYGKDESVRTAKIWKEVLAHGEIIKFIHHAIEWENVIYFLYPYFWSQLSRWDLKKTLTHPDPTHQAFLKAGSARVVLTIRPGFERAFVSLLEAGKFEGLPPDHPYLTIIEEMEKFAKTNYPGIPPANPEGAALNEEGAKIGTWHEYTPTSALDISFNETLPTA